MNLQTQSMNADKMSIQQAGANLNEWFKQAANLYKQTEDNYYTSSKNILGIHLSVLPNMVTNLFSIYSVGDEDNVTKLRKLYQEQNIFKTYCCSLCTIDEKDNAVIISQEQNQLYLNDLESPSVIINHKFEGITDKSGNIYKYIISGTVPQYFYNHLMLISENHIPTYGLFLDIYLFFDVMQFIKFANNDKLVAYHNGNFGSDTFHFHVHLSDQINTTIDTIVSTIPVTNGKFYYNDPGGIIKCRIYVDSDLSLLFYNLNNDIIPLLNATYENTNLVVSSSLFYRNGRYFVILNITNRTKGFLMYKGSNQNKMFPSAYALNTNIQRLPEDKSEYDSFVEDFRKSFDNYYSPETFMPMYPYNPNQYVFNDINIGIIGKEIQSSDNVEILFIKILYRYTKDQPQEVRDVIKNMSQLFLEYANNAQCLYSYDNCSIQEMGKFKYILGLAVNNIQPISILKDQKYQNLLLSNEYHVLNNYRNPSSNYLWFRGKFVQKLIVNTIHNLIRITGIQHGTFPDKESINVNSWIDFVFKQIGEISAFGTNTISSMKNLSTTIDFVIKIVRTDTDELMYKFLHEWEVSSAINDIRNLVPNFILCFGGFMCDSSNFDKLCDQGIGRNLSYLLLENVKKGDTLSRVLKTPTLFSDESVNDQVNICYQIITGLAFGYQLNKFTHYDLHCDNIMQYDFINNSEYLNLFSNFKEGDNIPEVKNVLFKYYLKNNEYILIPTKYLYVVIDYGQAYVEGVRTHIDPRLADIGMTSNRDNNNSDIFTFFMSYFISHILTYKPYLLIEKSTSNWKQNNLYRLFKKFIEAYEKMWKITPEQFLTTLLITAIQRDQNFEEVIYKNIKSEYKNTQRDIWAWKYLNPKFTPNLVHSNFNGSLNVCYWITNKITNQGKLQQIEKLDTTYVFNWGNIPIGIMDGIQPNAEIKALIKTGQDLKKQQIIDMKNFIKKL